MIITDIIRQREEDLERIVSEKLREEGETVSDIEKSVKLRI